jgi:hypothetical protein
MDSVVIELVIAIAIFGLGLIGGIGLHISLRRLQPHSGVIHITKTEDKTVFLLEVDDDPRELEYKSEVVFRVETKTE